MQQAGTPMSGQDPQIGEYPVCIHFWYRASHVATHWAAACTSAAVSVGGGGAWPLQSIKTAPSAVIVTMRMTALVFVILIIYRIDGAA
jgi:hypothetical protein